MFKLMKIICAAVISVSLLVAGCGTSTADSNENGQTDGRYKVGLVTGEQGIDDPVYAKAWEGFQEAEQKFEDVGTGFVKAKNDDSYASKLAELKDQDYKLIFTLGEGALPAVLEAADKNPGIKYVCLDASLSDPIPENVIGVSYKVEEAAFLAGYLAGKMTDSYVVGFISGDNKDYAKKYYYGYRAGVRYVSSGCELLKGIAATYTDEGRLKEMAESMVKSKADVIFHVAGSAGNGMFKVMEESGKYAIGSETDQSSLAPESVITSVIKNNDKIIFDMISQYVEKDLKTGENLVYGLAEDGVDLGGINQDMISEEINDSITDLKEKIIEGKMSVPENEEEYLNLTNN